MVPTYREASNMEPLIRGVQAALSQHPHEILIVDDNSDDGTAAAARAAGARAIVRKDERGLATAVMRGIAEAKGTYVLVMDADLQHPPEVAGRLLDAALEQDVDLVVGSRYAAGGDDRGFGPVRKTISWGARVLSKVAVPSIRRCRLSDPMSGLFLVRRSCVDLDAMAPTGYKILLEVIAKGSVSSVAEVGYAFGQREAGESKLGASTIKDYLVHLATLAAHDRENRRMVQFGLVGLSGMVVNLGLLWFLVDVLGLHYLASGALAVEASVVTNFLLNDRFTFHDRREGHHLMRLLRFNVVSLLAMGVNLLTLAVLTSGLHVHYLVSEAVAIVVAFAFNYMGNLHWTYGRLSVRHLAPWVPLLLVTVVAAGAYTVQLDSVHSLYFDEEYYVSVAKQMENGVWEDPCWDNDAFNHRPLNSEHPPLAKLILYWSTSAFDTTDHVFEGCRAPDSAGYKAYMKELEDHGNPYSWRVPSAIMGTLTVAMTGLAAHRLFRSQAAGVLAASFVLVDGVMLTGARIALLDIFATGFLMTAVATATSGKPRSRIWTGIWLGLGFASKFSAAFAGPAVLAIALWSQRREGVLDRRAFDRTVACIVGIPAVVLVLTYIPWWVQWIPEQGFGWSVRHWWTLQTMAFGTGAALQQEHPYASTPWSWWILERPMLYLKQDIGTAMTRRIYALGNLPLWWLGLATAVVTAIDAVNRKAWTPENQRRFLALGLLASMFAGFALLQRTTFLFYMIIVVPAIALLAGGVLGQWWDRDRRSVQALVLVGVGVMALWTAHFWPALSGEWMTNPDFDALFRFTPWIHP